jgi:hypothetical protein
MRKFFYIFLGLVLFSYLTHLFNHSADSQAGEPKAVAADAKPGTPAVAADAKAKPDLGFWGVGSDINQVDGSVSHFASMQHDEIISGRGVNEFHVRCSKNKTEAYITPWRTNGFAQLEVEDYESGRTQRVRYRVDDQKPVSQYWDISSDFHALFMPMSALRQIRKGKTLVVEFDPSFERRQTATLLIKGIDEAIKQTGCKS